MNKRKHQRQNTQQPAKSALLGDDPDSEPQLTLRPVIANISFGGLGLILIPPLTNDEVVRLQSGQNNLYAEFSLPPSLKTISVTAKVKWIKQKKYFDSDVTFLGAEFITKTPELYREIDKFFKSASPYSELYKNKRTFPRIASDLKGEFSIPGMKKFKLFAKYFPADIFNISAAGVMLSTYPPLNENELKVLQTREILIPLKFHLPTIKKHLTINCRPVHLRQLNKDGKIHSILGLKFVQMSESEQSRIIEFVCVKKAGFLKEEISKSDIKIL